MHGRSSEVVPNSIQNLFIPDVSDIFVDLPKGLKTEDEQEKMNQRKASGRTLIHDDLTFQVVAAVDRLSIESLLSSKATR